jgi:hypothetical protein
MAKFTIEFESDSLNLDTITEIFHNQFRHHIDYVNSNIVIFNNKDDEEAGVSIGLDDCEEPDVLWHPLLASLNRLKMYCVTKDYIKNDSKEK